MTIPPHEHDISYDRLLTFTDGIFSIAITLLALEIRIPEVTNNAELGQAIINLLPQIFIFVMSFVQVGIFWLAHHRMFRMIERSDSKFMWMCLFYLMLIAFLPVPSATLARYGSEFPVVVFFAITLMILGLVELMIWQYASANHRLMRADVTMQQIQATKWRTVNIVVMFGVSIGIAFISPLLAMLSWLSLFVTQTMISRRFREVTDTPPKK